MDSSKAFPVDIENAKSQIYYPKYIRISNIFVGTGNYGSYIHVLIPIVSRGEAFEK